MFSRTCGVCSCCLWEVKHMHKLAVFHCSSRMCPHACSRSPLSFRCCRMCTTSLPVVVMLLQCPCALLAPSCCSARCAWQPASSPKSARQRQCNKQPAGKQRTYTSAAATAQEAKAGHAGHMWSAATPCALPVCLHTNSGHTHQQAR
jgi:hypothetical protein